MPLIKVNSIDDPRLAPYRQLPKTRPQGELFIAEGFKLTERLLASNLQTHSLLVEQRAAEHFAERAPAETPIYVAAKEQLETVVGFDFHRAVLACGVRPANPRLADLFPAARETLTAVVLPYVQDAENVGGILRTSAALGVDAVLLGPASADPFARRVVRVSMGAVLALPIYVAGDLAADLATLREEFGFETAAAVLDDDAAPLDKARRAARFALMLGSEADGLAPQWLAHCDRRVKIAMQPGVDSLNVSVAAGIMLHHFTRKENWER